MLTSWNFTAFFLNFPQSWHLILTAATNHFFAPSVCIYANIILFRILLVKIKAIQIYRVNIHVFCLVENLMFMRYNRIDKSEYESGK